MAIPAIVVLLPLLAVLKPLAYTAGLVAHILVRCGQDVKGSWESGWEMVD